MSRARDLGIPLEGVPGKYNAITDVAGVEVGHCTLITGEGNLEIGKGPVRTGVTAILPRGKTHKKPVFAGFYALNGNGEMTGTIWVEESGFIEGPVMITNTHSVGTVRDATIEWISKTYDSSEEISWSLPVVGETYDGALNDINGFHVKKEHVFEALDQAKSGKVAEGCVGGGTGMITHGFKAGIGTASRKVEIAGKTYTLGVLVQSNYDWNREVFTVAGVPVHREITDLKPELTFGQLPDDGGSIIVVVATDAPLLPHQLKRLARRVPIGISRVGGYGQNGSGDIFIAFSTANPDAAQTESPANAQFLPNELNTPLFKATAEATEEAILNALCAAETMVGINGNTVHALPKERLVEVLKKYNRFKK